MGSIMNINLFIRKDNKTDAFVVINVLLLITMLTSLLLFKVCLIQLEAKNIASSKQLANELVYKREIFKKLFEMIESNEWEDRTNQVYSFKKLDDLHVIVYINEEEYIVYHEFVEDKK